MAGGTVVSLFSDCGGLDLGFKERGFEPLYACDSDPAAVDCYRRNVDARVHLQSVCSRALHRAIASLGRVDVVLGGFPCQGFSKAGPKSASDSRNALYMEMRQAVRTLQPKLFIAENVDGISQNFGGAYLKRIVADFREIGYEVEFRLLDAIAFGTPQHRRRMIFVGTREGAGGSFQWPRPTHKCDVRNGEFKAEAGPLLWDNAVGHVARLKKPLAICDAIADLLDLDPRMPDHAVTNAWPRKYAAVMKAVGQGQKLCNVRHAPTSVYTWQVPEVFGDVTDRERLVLETIGKNRRHKKYGNIPNGNPLAVDVIERLAGLRGIGAEIRALLKKGYLKEKGGKYDLKGAMFCSGLFKRPRWDEPSPTVLTNFHNPRYFIHPLRDRPFSLRETARLQGFPDTFVFAAPGSPVDLLAGYRLVGNAVPPPLARALAGSVDAFLRGNNANESRADETPLRAS